MYMLASEKKKILGHNFHSVFCDIILATSW